MKARDCDYQKGTVIRSPDPTRDLLYVIDVIFDDEENKVFLYSDSTVSLDRLVQLCSISGHVVGVNDINGSTVLF